MPKAPLIEVVDDDREIPAVLSSLLRSMGYEAEIFSSACQLLERANLAEFSCIISDIHMPAMNGLELALKLTTLEPGLPVILMTGRVEPGLKEKAYASGALNFLVKPFDFGVLSESLQKVLASPRRSRAGGGNQPSCNRS